jgi:hypothetical protein
MISNDLSALWKKRGEMKRKKKELHADNVRRRRLRKRSAGIKRKRKKQKVTKHLHQLYTPDIG